MDLTVSRAERQSRPPALPVKQRRSQYSRGSSSVGSSVDLELDGGASSPFAPQNQGSAYTDVFLAPTDCHAPQCPIHQRYDPSYCHQERFFSDTTTPPPVPTKRVARAMSLPGPGVDLSPLPPLPYNHHSYDNPLYMFTTIADTQPYLERQQERRVQESPLPLQPLSQLNFDTPDKQLPYFFSDFSNQEEISQGIQQRHLLFLQSMAQGLEAGPPLEGEYREVAASTFQPQDFLLREGYQSNQIEGVFYYSLQSPKFPRRVLCAKVISEVTPPTNPFPQPPHVNIQQVIAYFPPCYTPEKELNTATTQETMILSLSSQSHRTTPKPPCGGSVELVDQGQPASTATRGPTVLSLLQQGFAVSIERDFPQATLDDFVIEGRSLWSSEPPVYERQLCILLLQLALGLQHLGTNASTATCAELKPRGIFLVWPGSVRDEKRERGEGGGEEETAGKTNDAVEGGGQAGTGAAAGNAEERNGRDEVLEREKKEKLNEGIQTLWRKWGSPRLVLTLHPSPFTLPLHTQAAPTLQSQLGALLQYCLPLHVREQATSRTQGSDDRLQSSPYLPGLLRLASWLQDERNGPQIADTVGVLQALLWGPRAELFGLNRTAEPSTLHSWLSVKRALLLLKLAERGLSQDQSSLDWEDCLCLQYFSSADPGSVMTTTARLGLHNTAGSD